MENETAEKQKRKKKEVEEQDSYRRTLTQKTGDNPQDFDDNAESGEFESFEDEMG